MPIGSQRHGLRIQPFAVAYQLNLFISVPEKRVIKQVIDNCILYNVAIVLFVLLGLIHWLQGFSIENGAWPE